MSLRWYEHLGLGLVGLATALSLNVVYPVKKPSSMSMNQPLPQIIQIQYDALRPQVERYNVNLNLQLEELVKKFESNFNLLNERKIERAPGKVSVNLDDFLNRNQIRQIYDEFQKNLKTKDNSIKDWPFYLRKELLKKLNHFKTFLYINPDIFASSEIDQLEEIVHAIESGRFFAGVED